MRILVLGKSGMLGHVVYNHFKENGYTVFGTTQTDEEIEWDAYLNLEKIEDIIQEVKPDAVINCIGILNQVCDVNKPLAVKLNIDTCCPGRHSKTQVSLQGTNTP